MAVKAYPYPVLDEQNNFKHNLAEDAALYYFADRADADHFLLQVEFSLDQQDNPAGVPEIKTLIENGKAIFFVKVECIATMFSRAWTFTYDDNGRAIFEVKIPKDKVFGTVTVSCQVKANDEIKQYKCADFNDVYYGDLAFDLEKGDVMVQYRDFEFDTRLKPIEEAQLGDYIEFCEGNDDNIRFDITSKIQIILPKKTNKMRLDNQETLDRNSAIQHSACVFPALIYALCNLEGNQQTVWAKSIKMRLEEDATIFTPGKDYTVDADGNLHVEDPVAVASKILDNPLMRMYKGMKTYTNNNDTNN